MKHCFFTSDTVESSEMLVERLTEITRINTVPDDACHADKCKYTLSESDIQLRKAFEQFDRSLQQVIPPKPFRLNPSVFTSEAIYTDVLENKTARLFKWRTYAFTSAISAMVILGVAWFLVLPMTSQTPLLVNENQNSLHSEVTNELADWENDLVADNCFEDEYWDDDFEQQIDTIEGSLIRLTGNSTDFDSSLMNASWGMNQFVAEDDFLGPELY